MNVLLNEFLEKIDDEIDESHIIISNIEALLHNEETPLF